ncbi:MAG: DUF4245 family protein [Microbacterium gubbeenense]|uniref:DUF4245 family protein n=1 Tax=Microbacterium gubbeenense TaxID=159896 RepID=UPI003F9C4CBF
MARAPREPRIAAHLGRPETPAEEAARKAENSKSYRQSQSFRNLIIALVASLAIVAVVYFIVPRGEIEHAPQPDVAETARQVADQYERTVVVPGAPDDWAKNSAQVDAGSPSVWSVNYNDIPDAGRAFVRFEQAFDADEVWASQILRGTSPSGTTTIDGLEWTEFDVRDPDSTGNVSYALGIQAGSDYVLIYGSADSDVAALLASSISDDVAALQKEAA